MSVFRRLALLVFGICGAFCLAALTLPWFGPWTQQATELLYVRWYYVTVEVTLAITALGVLLSLLRALFTPRTPATVEVAHVGDDAITVSRAAISSLTTQVIERNGYVAERVSVRVRRRGVNVSARVRPYRSVLVPEDGPALRATLMKDLANLIGDALVGVELEFLEPSMSMDEAGYAVHGDELEAEVGTEAQGTPTRVVPTSSRREFTVAVSALSGSAGRLPGHEEGSE